MLLLDIFHKARLLLFHYEQILYVFSVDLDWIFLSYKFHKSLENENPNCDCKVGVGFQKTFHMVYTQNLDISGVDILQKELIFGGGIFGVLLGRLSGF